MTREKLGRSLVVDMETTRCRLNHERKWYLPDIFKYMDGPVVSFLFRLSLWGARGGVTSVDVEDVVSPFHPIFEVLGLPARKNIPIQGVRVDVITFFPVTPAIFFSPPKQVAVIVWALLEINWVLDWTHLKIQSVKIIHTSPLN